VLLSQIIFRFLPHDWSGFLWAAFQTVVCLAAALAGGLIVGIERERVHRPAGVRTHVLVSVGTAGFVHLGVLAGGVDFYRLIQAIATGIGFLGAGAIFRHGEDVRGVTTAASLWAIGAVGAAAGAGAILFALFLACVYYVVLRWLRFLDRPKEEKEQK
jgi:putative Mg2+ transporter-C (MgtC) family protein